MRVEILRQFVDDADAPEFDAFLASLQAGHARDPIGVRLRSVDGGLREVHIAADTHLAPPSADGLVPPVRATLVLTDSPACGDHDALVSALNAANAALDAERSAIAEASRELDAVVRSLSEGRAELSRVEAAYAATRAELAKEQAARVELSKEVDRMTLIDALTGLPSRRRFFEEAERELARARRFDRPCSVLLVDLDMLHRLVERYGHGVADRALCHATTVLRGVARRPSDLIARLGSQQLAVLLPDTDEHGASVIAERLRAALEDSPFVLRDDAMVITGSFGLAELAEEDPGVDALLGRADRAMRVAKGRGGNRCEGGSSHDHASPSRRAPSPSHAPGP
jgi:diguanylate cyclase (GGDEF)-like protein